MLRISLLGLAVSICLATSPATSLARDTSMLDAEWPRFVQSPPGFQAACFRYDWLCAAPTNSAAILTEQQILKIAASVNQVVNGRIGQATDLEIHGRAEYWTLPDRGVGDCEDIALEKMFQLLGRGIPADRLLIAIGLNRHGENHAVLLLRTSRETLALDSRHDRLLAPGESGYQMLAMQSPRDRTRWEIMDQPLIAAHRAQPAPERPQETGILRQIRSGEPLDRGR